MFWKPDRRAYVWFYCVAARCFARTSSRSSLCSVLSEYRATGWVSPVSTCALAAARAKVRINATNGGDTEPTALLSVGFPTWPREACAAGAWERLAAFLNWLVCLRPIDIRSPVEP